MLYNLLCVSVFSKHVLSNRFIKEHTLDLWIPPQLSSTHRQLCIRKHLQRIRRRSQCEWVQDYLDCKDRVWTCMYIHGFMLCTGLICTCRKLVKICGTGTGRLNTLQTQRLDRLAHAQHWTDSCSLSLSLGTVLILFIYFFKPSSKITAGTSESLTAC